MLSMIEELRGFNRFYTHRIGLLDEHFCESAFSLPEARVLYELSRRSDGTAAEIARALDMDKAHLSRILTRFRSRGLVVAAVSSRHAKHRLLSLTEAGRAAFSRLERGTIAQMRSLLEPLDPSSARRLSEAMREIQAVWSADQRRDGPAFTLRQPKVGDLGWVIHRQAALYAREYGWDWTFEGLLCGILAGFVAGFDPAREEAWIAEHHGAVAGSVFLMRGNEPGTAKLRMLYVEPEARGLGIGAALVAACITRAREAGYRRLTLWTNDILVSARRIYEAAGFRLVEEEPHRSFGHDLVGQNWLLDLEPH